MPDDPDLHKIIAAYKEKFGDVPTLVGLGDDDYEIAVGLLEDAIDRGKPWKDDAEFYAALGIDLPPPDAVI
jgi:hypothetical protein